MKIKSLVYIDKTEAQTSINFKRNRIMKGLDDTKLEDPATLKRKRGKKSFDLKRDFNRYVDDNYGDILEREDKDTLFELIAELYDDGKIKTYDELITAIHALGKEEGLIFE